MCADVVGRQAELDSVGRFLDSVSDGPAARILRGEAGLGKTTLWQVGLDEANHRGYQSSLAVRLSRMEVFSATLPIETLQPPYHLFRRDVEASILPYARAHDTGTSACADRSRTDC